MNCNTRAVLLHYEVRFVLNVLLLHARSVSRMTLPRITLGMSVLLEHFML